MAEAHIHIQFEQLRAWMVVYIVVESEDDGRSWRLVGEPHAAVFASREDAFLLRAQRMEEHPDFRCEVHPMHPHLLLGFMAYHADPRSHKSESGE